MGVILDVDNMGVNLAREPNGMVAVPQRKAVGRVAAGKGEAIADLMLEVHNSSFEYGPWVREQGSSQAGAAEPSASCAAWR